ncbi:hypothetical protein PIB30_035356 [Stylosanthes scabra]|uniref:Uncharacterized protein n=1 Tax=Stylosanthes scabra TaxID=79078 RepID=A0ABU6WD91_9FABA|nr:hypothetical protein [Stylosanthes scabra]
MDGTYEQPRSPTSDVDFAPDNYTQWVADMIAQSSYQPPPDVSYWGTHVQHTEPFAHECRDTAHNLCPTSPVDRRGRGPR